LEADRRRGFSLTELMVVLAIMGILFGLAIFGFIGLSRSMRLSSATRALNQVMVNARQQAITSRSPRRVGINLVDGSFWTERKNVRSGRVESVPWELASDVEHLPKQVVVGDIGGFTADSIPGNEKVWYTEFDPRGSASSYAKGQQPERKNMAVHLIMENARIPLSETDKRMYNLGDAGLVGYINSIQANDVKPADGQDDGLPSVDIKTSAEARKQVNTVFILSLTGRSQVFEYGYEFPWSEVDVVER